MEKCPYCGSTDLLLPIKRLHVRIRNGKKGIFTVFTDERPTECAECGRDFPSSAERDEVNVYDDYYFLKKIEGLPEILSVLGIRDADKVRVVAAWTREGLLVTEFELTYPGVWHISLEELVKGRSEMITDWALPESIRETLWPQVVSDLPEMDPIEITNPEEGTFYEGVVGLFDYNGTPRVEPLFGKRHPEKIEKLLWEELI